MRRLIVLTGIVGLVTAVLASAASADENYAKWNVFGNANSVQCAMAGAGHITDASPDKWNSATANRCFSNFDVRAKVRLFDSGGNLVASCDTGTATNYAQCQVGHAPAFSNEHVNVWRPGDANEFTLFSTVWSSTD
jgi:hypothetical protein